MKIFYSNKTTDKVSTFDTNKTLTEIANALETDKGTFDSSLCSWGKNWPEHKCMHYTTTYEKYMDSYRDKPINFLEIGICDQRFPYASPKMWLQYFSQINLSCMDNFWGSYIENKKSDIEMLNDLGVDFIYADQGNFCDWSEIKSKYSTNYFDFIVEDGSHWPNHMAVSLWQSIDILKINGYYFMEDLQNPITSRGKFRYDNSLLTENLLNSLKTNILNISFLNDKQNQDIKENFDLIEMVLDPHQINYLAVFKRKIDL